MRNRIAKALLLIALTIAAAAHILTYVALGDPAWVSFSLGLVVISFLAAVAGIFLTNMPRTQLPSRGLGILAALLVVYALIMFAELHSRMGGAWNLEETGGRYLLENNGKVIRTISQQEYWTFEGLFFRTWSAVAGAISVFGLARLRR
ncbi:MAG TPA: hypothetical protein VML19_21540 [Verrucomicrobiae bacterium]|nr:hypothetical protein [Verrucomicrobiae bacterium]